MANTRTQSRCSHEVTVKNSGLLKCIWKFLDIPSPLSTPRLPIPPCVAPDQAASCPRARHCTVLLPKHGSIPARCAQQLPAPSPRDRSWCCQSCQQPRACAQAGRSEVSPPGAFRGRRTRAWPHGLMLRASWYLTGYSLYTQLQYPKKGFFASLRLTSP